MSAYFLLAIAVCVLIMLSCTRGYPSAEPIQYRRIERPDYVGNARGKVKFQHWTTTPFTRKRLWRRPNSISCAPWAGNIQRTAMHKEAHPCGYIVYTQHLYLHINSLLLLGVFSWFRLQKGHCHIFSLCGSARVTAPTSIHLKDGEYTVG